MNVSDLADEDWNKGVAGGDEPVKTKAAFLNAALEPEGYSLTLELPEERFDAERSPLADGWRRSEASEEATGDVVWRQTRRKDESAEGKRVRKHVAAAA